MVDATTATTATATTTSMVDATLTSTTHGTTNTTMLDTTMSVTGNTATDHLEAELPSSSSGYLCTSCRTSFSDNQEQRTHMKAPWHVYNIKRRIASLPPVSREDFEKVEKSRGMKAKGKSKAASSRADQGFTSSASSSSSSSSSEDEVSKQAQLEEMSEHEHSDAASSTSTHSATPFRCLFCPQCYPSDDGLASNLTHMRTAHGLFIPHAALVVDMPTLISYLSTEVRSWHECLYCGATKDSTASVQAHMRDTQHCRLNLEREPELWDFWEGGEEGVRAEAEERRQALNAEQQQRQQQQQQAEKLALASGKVVASRHAKKTSSKRTPLSSAKALPSTSDTDSDAAPPPPPPPPPPATAPKASSSRQLARREELGILGISAQQRSALVLAEKKAQRSEDVARRAREWVVQRGANTQKHDQMDTTKAGKRGKQSHKLQPR